MASKQPTYDQNFHKALKQYMVDQDLENVKDVAGKLKINYQTLLKIYNGGQKPTVSQCNMLCRAGGFSANWMYLNIGEMKLEYQSTLNEIHNLLKKKN